MIHKLSKIQELREQEQKLLAEKQKEEDPLLSDTSLLPQLYEWFSESTENLPDKDKVTRRREFLFIALFLYSPKTLVCGHLPKGLRDILTSIFAPIKKSSISNDVKYLLFNFKQYKGFRESVGNSYKYIIGKLNP